MNATALRIVTFLITFFGSVGAGLLLLWVMNWTEKGFLTVAIPGLLFGSLLLASVSSTIQVKTE